MIWSFVVLLLSWSALICGQELKEDHFLVTVKSGKGKDAGTDSRVLIALEDHNCETTKPFPIKPLSTKDLLKQEGTKSYIMPLPKGFGRTMALKLTLDNKPGVYQDWYCDHIFVEDPRVKKTSYFPIDRRIEGNQMYMFHDYATCLPQFDPSNNTRELTLRNKRKEYQFTNHIIATQVKDLPRDEHFSQEYFSKLLSYRTSLYAKRKTRVQAWRITNNISTIYGESYYEPKCTQFWKEDLWFAAQRVQGIVPNIIELCKKIPDKFGVTDVIVNGLLEGFTLQQALENNKIFITDLYLLDGIDYFNNMDHASPIAVFYLNKMNQLMPIAIQLQQRKGPNNPVYTPNDPPSTWLVAKMYYNNAEAQLHQFLLHFGYTHALMDGVATSLNRQLSPSHPIFKLMKPHLLYLLAINKLAESQIFASNGTGNLWSIGIEGSKPLLQKGIPLFTFKRAIGSVKSDARSRGVWDKQVLPYYPFRDDATSIYNIIEKYVTTIITQYYDTPEKLQDDWELHNWRAELTRPRGRGGIGIPDLPGSATSGFREIGEIINLVTMLITHNSVGHAAVNFLQYDTYGHLPNYPAAMNEGPPQQKREYTEDEIMGLLPDKWTTFVIMGEALTLSLQETNAIGDFEKVYLFDPVSHKAHMELKKDLKEFSEEVKNRNRDRIFPYKYLDPNYFPNAISV